jgi:hypothetical protein
MVDGKPTDAVSEPAWSGLHELLVNGGRARLERGSDADRVASAVYERFLGIDRDLQDIVSLWQAAARPDGPLTGAERGLVDNLRRLADRATPLLRRLSEGVPGFAAYTNRLHASLGRLDDGEREYFCVGPDSFHTVCSQLHEELLLCLGLDRRDEPSQ